MKGVAQAMSDIHGPRNIALLRITTAKTVGCNVRREHRESDHAEKVVGVLAEMIKDVRTPPSCNSSSRS
jgi:hypothetical protein